MPFLAIALATTLPAVFMLVVPIAFALALAASVPTISPAPEPVIRRALLPSHCAVHGVTALS